MSLIGRILLEILIWTKLEILGLAPPFSEIEPQQSPSSFLHDATIK